MIKEESPHKKKYDCVIRLKNRGTLISKFAESFTKPPLAVLLELMIFD